ncbi:MAG: UDPGP type 1 family protein [Phycisphaerae bacterium]|jgi:UDP-N-acetylglucosamine/UDP-N-acetylgalactosamine diphosphorylase
MAELNLENAKKMLKNHHQEHLLKFWDQLNESQRESLLEQIGELDLGSIDKWISDVVLNTEPVAIKGKIEPAPYYPAKPSDKTQAKFYAKAAAAGEEKIRTGKVSAFIVAGGQGTRLGFDGPKGDFPISPVRNKTFFQLFAEQIKAACQKYCVELPWYIMTSPLNHEVTCDIFEKNNCFGLDPLNIFIFQQGTMPNFGPDGRILPADKATISCSPDGHGGSIKALYKSGAIADMKKRGVEYISYFQVDNPLIDIFDPLFIGLHVLDESEMSSKALRKTSPTEKVGNFCLLDGRVTVIEYSDLDDELAHKTKDDGSYVFEMGSIAIHIISVPFVEKLNSKGFSLPLHRAVKKIECIDENGNHIEPDEPNGIKLETFVFDALPMAEKSTVLETIREREFAPVKNESGTDSPESARRMMIERWAGWLESAGINVPRNADGTVNARIEIAQGFALDGDELKTKADRIPDIKPGGELYLQ